MPTYPIADYQFPYADDPTNSPPEADLSPLAIIVNTMRERYLSGDVEGAIALARIAAPYLHPRPIATKPHTDLATMTDAELDALRYPD